jgi:hypothetical protein
MSAILTKLIPEFYELAAKLSPSHDVHTKRLP